MSGPDLARCAEKIYLDFRQYSLFSSDVFRVRFRLAHGHLLDSLHCIIMKPIQGVWTWVLSSFSHITYKLQDYKGGGGRDIVFEMNTMFFLHLPVFFAAYPFRLAFYPGQDSD